MTTARLDPLTEPRPDLTPEAVAATLATHWGVHGELEPLHGERDLNFRVVDGDGRRYVAKVHNPADGVGVVDFQTRAVSHIRSVAPALPVSDVVPTTDGRAWITVDDDRARTCIVRLLTHLDGRHPRDDEMREDDLVAWGAMVARLGVALRGFVHPESGYPIAWDIRRLPAVRGWTTALDDERRRAVIAVIDRHEQVVAAPLATVRAQIVHNDIALGNVLVDEHRRVSGITDFGDMTHTALVCDLAVTIADVLSGRDDWSPQAEAIIAGYASVTPLTPDEIDLLPDLIAGRCAAAMTISSWRDATQDVSPGPSLGGWQMLQDIAELDRAELRARFTAAASGAPSHRRRTTSELLAAREQVLGPLALSYATPLHLVRGEGVELEAADGRRYLDAYNNVPVLGHSHPAMTAAVTAQLQMLNSNTRYLHEAPIRLAEELLASMPPGRFDRVLFVNSGSEANDLAWRIACFATGHAGAIVTEFAYHGVTTVTTALSPETGVDPAAFAVRRVAPPPPVGTSEPDVARAVGELGTVGVAAMFVDGVFTSDGVLGPAHQWTRAAAAAVHAAGGVYVADEVQAGYGRTGEHLWSFAAGGVDADLVTLGKPMGNGFPVAAVVTRGELVDEFMQRTDYFSTFGGSPVACAAGLAVLDTIRREGLVTNARIVGDVLRSRLADMAATSPRLGAPRGWGLAVGVDVLDDDGEPDAATAQRVVNGLRERGVLIGRTAATGATLKIRPPLVFTERHAGRLAIDLGAVLTSLSAT